jgi:hypothetical protein
MKKKFILILLLLIAAVLLAYSAFRDRTRTIEQYISLADQPSIDPDYRDIVLPYNIAAVNFQITEPASAYQVKISSTNGKPIEIFTRKADIRIPMSKWKSLLDINKGQKLFFDIYTMNQGGQWSKYAPIANTISQDNIDGYIAYRLMHPIYNYWEDIGIYQRDLESYDESRIIWGYNFKNGCVNCHSFLNNRGERMLLAIRSSRMGSSEILVDGKVKRIGTKFGYTSWHPSGQMAAYSVNKVRQFFHFAGTEVRDVIDLDSAICYYDLKADKVLSHPLLAKKDRLETYPAWSPDGNFLYFCSAPLLWQDQKKIIPPQYKDVKYDLMRISYDIETDKWGQIETVLTAEETGKSILLPRISPDGKHLLFCMTEYGCFPVYQPSSDLYMMEIETGQYRKLDINSDHSESWHSWSSNSRWIAFSSKRRGGLYTRTFLSHVDENGNASKPFVMPQKDPLFYDQFLKTYSVPELIATPVKVRETKLVKAIRSKDEVSYDLPLTGATPSDTENLPWQQERE